MTKLALCAALAALTAGPAAAAPSASQPVVVELFTSQGCSSCPPANAHVNRLAERPDVLALTFGVQLWDYLGWKDTFAQGPFSQRQLAYNQRFGRGANVYTPQVVVGGRVHAPGTRPGEIESMMRRAGPSTPAPVVSLDKGSVTVGRGGAPKAGAEVWLVRYDPRTVQVPIRRGENGGKTLPHKNVVRELTRLGSWTGDERRFVLPATAHAGLRTAVLVQNAQTGQVIAAGKG